MQLSLGYSPEHQGRETWRLEIDWACRAVAAIGHKDVAFALDIAPSTLTDALHERDRKGVKAEWLRVIVHMSPDGMRREWLRIVSRPLGFEPERIKTMDAAEELRILRELLQRQAPVVLQAIDKELGR
jgi:hypothetical protein